MNGKPCISTNALSSRTSASVCSCIFAVILIYCVQQLNKHRSEDSSLHKTAAAKLFQALKFKSFREVKDLTEWKSELSLCGLEKEIITAAATNSTVTVVMTTIIRDDCVNLSVFVVSWSLWAASLSFSFHFLKRWKQKSSNHHHFFWVNQMAQCEGSRSQWQTQATNSTELFSFFTAFLNVV